MALSTVTGSSGDGHTLETLVFVVRFRERVLPRTNFGVREDVKIHLHHNQEPSNVPTSSFLFL